MVWSVWEPRAVIYLMVISEFGPRTCFTNPFHISPLHTPFEPRLFWFHAPCVSRGQTAWGLKSRHQVRRVFLRPNPLKYVRCARAVRFHALFIVFRGRETGRCESESARTACADPISRRDPTAVTSWISSCRVRLGPRLPGGSRRGSSPDRALTQCYACYKDSALQFSCFIANASFWRSECFTIVLFDVG